MNTRKICLATAVVAAIAAPAAAGTPVFEAFRKVCGDTHADYASIVSALNTNGWKQVDTKGSTMEGVKVTDSISRGLTVGESHLTLFAWRGAKGDVQISACTVRASPAKSDPLKADARTWTGFDPQSVDAQSGRIGYQFTDDADAHRALAKTDYDAAAAGAGLELMTLSTDGSDTILDLLKIKK